MFTWKSFFGSFLSSGNIINAFVQYGFIVCLNFTVLAYFSSFFQLLPFTQGVVTVDGSTCVIWQIFKSDTQPLKS